MLTNLRSTYRAATLVAVVACLAACSKAKDKDKDKDKAKDDQAKPGKQTPAKSVESTDILARTTVAPEAYVKHILISWKALARAFGGRQNPKGAARSRSDADKLAVEIADKLRADPKQLDALTKQYSEDPGSLRGRAYKATPRSRLVAPFKRMALRLKVGEVGIVKSKYGYHIMIRTPPPPPPKPDPLDSVDILKRPPQAKTKVKHILLGWDKVNGGDPRARKRSRADLEKLVADTLAKIKKGVKFEKLMAELSEDPGSAKSGRSYDATPQAGLVPPFKKLSLRLKKDEVGVVKTRFGIHIIKRVE